MPKQFLPVESILNSFDHWHGSSRWHCLCVAIFPVPMPTVPQTRVGILKAWPLRQQARPGFPLPSILTKHLTQGHFISIKKSLDRDSYRLQGQIVSREKTTLTPGVWGIPEVRGLNSLISKYLPPGSSCLFIKLMCYLFKNMFCSHGGDTNIPSIFKLLGVLCALFFFKKKNIKISWNRLDTGWLSSSVLPPRNPLLPEGLSNNSIKSKPNPITMPHPTTSPLGKTSHVFMFKYAQGSAQLELKISLLIK